MNSSSSSSSRHYVSQQQQQQPQRSSNAVSRDHSISNSEIQRSLDTFRRFASETNSMISNHARAETEAIQFIRSKPGFGAIDEVVDHLKQQYAR